MKKPTVMVAKAKTFCFIVRPVASTGAAMRPTVVALISHHAGRPPAVTDKPGRSRPSSDASPSSRIRTGTRCTILVKLPVAFSGGSTLNCAPVAGARLATWPWNVTSGSTSAWIVAG